MAEEIKAERVKHKFACGNDFTNLTVVNFVGPCCNLGEIRNSIECF